jgi:hypothetical protein
MKLPPISLNTIHEISNPFLFGHATAEDIQRTDEAIKGLGFYSLLDRDELLVKLQKEFLEISIFCKTEKRISPYTDIIKDILERIDREIAQSKVTIDREIAQSNETIKVDLERLRIILNKIYQSDKKICLKLKEGIPELVANNISICDSGITSWKLYTVLKVLADNSYIIIPEYNSSSRPEKSQKQTYSSVLTFTTKNFTIKGKKIVRSTLSNAIGNRKRATIKDCEKEMSTYSIFEEEIKAIIQGK